MEAATVCNVRRCGDKCNPSYDSRVWYQYCEIEYLVPGVVEPASFTIAKSYCDDWDLSTYNFKSNCWDIEADDHICQCKIELCDEEQTEAECNIKLCTSTCYPGLMQCHLQEGDTTTQITDTECSVVESNPKKWYACSKDPMQDSVIEWNSKTNDCGNG